MNSAEGCGFKAFNAASEHMAVPSQGKHEKGIDSLSSEIKRNNEQAQIPVSIASLSAPSAFSHSPPAATSSSSASSHPAASASITFAFAVDDEVFDLSSARQALPHAPSFDLGDWKRMYSTSAPSIAMAALWRDFDKANWCMYECVYKYSFDFTGEPIYKTVGLINGWIQRAHSLRPNAFATISMFANPADVREHNIRGVWIFRGQDICPDMLDCTDSDLYDWTRLDTDSDSERIRIGQYFARTDVDGLKFLDGSIFK